MTVEHVSSLRPLRAGPFLRLFAWMRGGRPVLLRDFQGEVYKSIAVADGFGGVRAPVYWFYRVGSCTLLPDGSVCRKSASAYVHEWAWFDGAKNDR